MRNNDFVQIAFHTREGERAFDVIARSRGCIWSEGLLILVILQGKVLDRDFEFATQDRGVSLLPCQTIDTNRTVRTRSLGDFSIYDEW